MHMINTESHRCTHHRFHSKPQYEMTLAPTQTPVSMHARSGLYTLPTEIRLEIFNQVLNISNVPRSYGYTSALKTSHHSTLSKHGMILVSKKLSAEYRQAFYERTRFFLLVNHHNAFKGVPALKQGSEKEASGSALPTFWDASDALLACLRCCTLLIELGDIASTYPSSHSVSQIVRSNSDRIEAGRVRNEMKAFHSLDELKAQDTSFDMALQTAVHNLLAHMQQLRSVQLVWETTVSGIPSTRWATNWTWAAFGQPFVEFLMTKQNLSELQVKVGDQRGDVVFRAERVEGRKWAGEKVAM